METKSKEKKFNLAKMLFRISQEGVLIGQNDSLVLYALIKLFANFFILSLPALCVESLKLSGSCSMRSFKQ